MNSKKGIMLVQVLLIAALFLIVALATVTITTTSLQLSFGKGEAERALALADAGVQQAMYIIETQMACQEAVNVRDKKKIQEGCQPPLEDPLRLAFDNQPDNDLPDFQGSGTMEITFDSTKKYFSTNNFYSSSPFTGGWGGRTVPPYSVHIIATGRTDSTTKRIEAIITKIWPYGVYKFVPSIMSTSGVLHLWSSTIDGDIFSPYIEVGDQNNSRSMKGKNYTKINSNSINGELFSISGGNVFKYNNWRDSRTLQALIADGKKPKVIVYNSTTNTTPDQYKKSSFDKNKQPAISDFTGFESPKTIGKDITIPGVERVVRSFDCYERVYDRETDTWTQEFRWSIGLTYYYLKEDVELSNGNYYINGNLHNYKLRFSSACPAPRVYGYPNYDTLSTAKLRINNGGLHVNGILALDGNKVGDEPIISMEDSIIHTDSTMLLGSETTRTISDREDGTSLTYRLQGKNCKIEGSGILSSDGSIYLENGKITAKTGETLVIYSKDDLIVSAPSEISGIIAVSDDVVAEPNARLKINGMFLNFSGRADSYMTNVDLTYEPSFARGLNSSSVARARLILWQELP